MSAQTAAQTLAWETHGHTWDAVLCENCHWNAYDMRGVSDRHEPPPRWCPECERHHHVRRELTLVTLTAQVRP